MQFMKSSFEKVMQYGLTVSEEVHTHYLSIQKARITREQRQRDFINMVDHSALPVPPEPQGTASAMPEIPRTPCGPLEPLGRVTRPFRRCDLLAGEPDVMEAPKKTTRRFTETLPEIRQITLASTTRLPVVTPHEDVCSLITSRIANYQAVHGILPGLIQVCTVRFLEYSDSIHCPSPIAFTDSGKRRLLFPFALPEGLVKVPLEHQSHLLYNQVKFNEAPEINEESPATSFTGKIAALMQRSTPDDNQSA